MATAVGGSILYEYTVGVFMVVVLVLFLVVVNGMVTVKFPQPPSVGSGIIVRVMLFETTTV